MVLALFLIYEQSKQEDSFYQPYFDILPTYDFPGVWEERTLKQIDCPILRSEMEEYTSSYSEEKEMIKKIIQIYTPALFSQSGVKEELIDQSFGVLQSRAYTFGTASTILSSPADMCNHESVSNVGLELVNKRMHLTDNQIYLQ